MEIATSFFYLVAGFLIIEFSTFRSDWRSYFDLIMFGGRKPKFFTESKPFVEVSKSCLYKGFSM